MKTKIRAGKWWWWYPPPTVLVGANVGGKPDFIAITHAGRPDMGTVSFGISKAHSTNAGIKANKTFSINLLTDDFVEKMGGYRSLVSGWDADKAKLCDVFYGRLQTAPMIRQCFCCMECRLVQIVDFPSGVEPHGIKHDVFVGEMVEAWGSELDTTAGGMDLVKTSIFGEPRLQARPNPAGTSAPHSGLPRVDAAEASERHAASR